jgi:hypothetical protein
MGAASGLSSPPPATVWGTSLAPPSLHVARSDRRRYAIDPVVVIAAVTLLLMLAATAAYVVIGQWRTSYPDADRHLPPLVLPLRDAWVAERASWLAAPAIDDETAAETELEPVTDESRWAPPGAGTESPEAPAAPPAPTHVAGEPAPEGAYPTDDADERIPAPTETVRFRRPGEDALQLLPGRLEVLAGEPRHREFRLLRVPGERPQVILGREPGPSPQHVALQSATVSRRHARLAYANGGWAVANLSQTNPVVLNEEEISNLDGERPLSDGDRIELGEVVLRFHAH